ncbi:LuxR C-terminal-related transcriptional regulator, partial [Streptomyces sp. NPDC059851]|uniref:helix-turn-helix transcriptional regulator n=1 Tax=Streptomyces sp. NPDC059851 TaxID=3346971 RepID=UPI003659E509
VLEDLHWADAASLDLLRHVTGQAAESRLLVIGTCREPVPEEAAGALADLRRYGASVLRLAPFTPEEVAQCLGGPGTAAESHRRTGGLPLLVAALRTHASDLGGVVNALLAGLGPDERTVVRAAAVLGGQLDAARLAPVLPELAGRTVGEALAAAWHAGVLTAEQTTDTGRTYRFSHDLVRDEVLGRTDPATLRSLHGAAARALEASGEAAAAARIAAHWRRAGREPGHRAADAHWSRIAADLARDRHAYADAARHLADAAAALDTRDPRRAPALLALARGEYLAGRYDVSLRHCAEAADAAGAADAADRPGLLAEAALVVQGVTFPQASRTIARLCEAALGNSEALPDRVRARLLAQLATASADLGSPAAAAGHARAALALAAAAGDPPAELDAARAVESTLAHPDDTAERLRLGDLAVARAEQLGDPLAAVLGHEWRVQAGYLLGRLDVVDGAVRAIESVTVRCGLPLARWHLLRVRAARAVQEGRFATAREYNAEAAALAAAGGDRTAAAMDLVLRQQLAHLRGDPAELGEAMWHDLEHGPRDPLFLSVRARALFLAGRPAEAQDVYAQLRPLLPVPTENPTWPAVLLHLVDLIAAAGDGEAARTVFDQLSPFAPYPGAIGTPTAWFAGSVHRELGRLAAAFGRPKEAEEHLRTALSRNRALGAQPYVALACLDLAAVLRDRGTLAEAAALAREARAIADRLDQPGPSAAAVGLMDEIAALRAEASPLTPREREIVVLVAQARTNRQIAQELVLSERTVESHVRSILGKLGYANRTELAARWTAPP